MKNGIIGFVIGLLIGGIGMYFLKKCDTEPVEVPIYIEIPIPVKDSLFDPIDDPKPLPSKPKMNPINKALKDQLAKVTSERDSLKVLKDFAVKRVYEETVEDSIQTITARVETTGTMDKIQLGYVQKPRTIKYKDTLTVDLPKSLERAVNLYIEGGVPFENNVDVGFKYKLGVDIVNKKKIIYGVSYAPQSKYIFGKIGKQFNF